jgi:general secretion pathway protein A
MLKQFNRFLLEELSKNNNVVLIIDEAQNLSPEMLEELRILSNLETEKEKLFQIVLVGQPELREKLNAPNLKQLRQRIGVRFHITSLPSDEMGEYIYHRLKIAGSNGDIKFSDDALDMIYKYSGGIPRLINMVCDKALLSAYALETKHIDAANIERCIKEIEGIVFAR